MYNDKTLLSHKSNQLLRSDFKFTFMTGNNSITTLYI